ESPGKYVSSVVRNESNQFLYRSFELDRIMSPDNGPASRRVARTVEQQLLTREPYKSYGVDVHEFFASGSDRVFGDMTGVVPPSAVAPASQTQYVTVNGKRLPKPSEGQPIPASAIGPALWTPGGTAQEVWTSPTEHHYVFSNPRDQQRSDKLGHDTERLANRI